MTAAPADGFEPVLRGGPFFAGLGAVYARGDVLAIRVGAQHVNDYGIAHGGMLVTLADGAMNRVLRRVRPEGERIVTVHLSVDYLAIAREGDWLEAHAHAEKQGRNLGFAECRLRAGAREVLKVSGVFAMTDGA